MTEQYQQELAKEIIGTVACSEIEAHSIIKHLLDLGALNLFWSPENRQFKAEDKQLELPQFFYMVSPLFKGKVTYVERQGWYGYQDEDDNVRVQASSKKQLAKKIVKYAK